MPKPKRCGHQILLAMWDIPLSKSVMATRTCISAVKNLGFPYDCVCVHVCVMVYCVHHICACEGRMWTLDVISRDTVHLVLFSTYCMYSCVCVCMCLYMWMTWGWGHVLTTACMNNSEDNCIVISLLSPLHAGSNSGHQGCAARTFTCWALLLASTSLSLFIA